MNCEFSNHGIKPPRIPGYSMLEFETSTEATLVTHFSNYRAPAADAFFEHKARHCCILELFNSCLRLYLSETESVADYSRIRRSLMYPSTSRCERKADLVMEWEKWGATWGELVCFSWRLCRLLKGDIEKRPHPVSHTHTQCSWKLSYTNGACLNFCVR